MKFYLSSYGFGEEVEKLKELASHTNKKVGYIPNAIDYSDDIQRKKESDERNLNSLRELGLEPHILDLREYFGKKEKLEKDIANLGMLWVRGGNTFVLRQAMSLSGLDRILKDMNREDFVYAGYSAGGCVLSPSLKQLQNVDNPTLDPYNMGETIWEGLGLIDYAFMPHFDSDHPESEDINKDIEYCKKNQIPFRAVRDGEVIIIE